MTGTAETEAEEFREIYNMDVLVIPTNREIIRLDHPDLVYKTTRAKYGAIVKRVREFYEEGAPVLIGTKSIEQNDIMARYLKRMKIPHQVLNAKNHEQEALIIADAGKPQAVTVATNIAGRGVDIVLGGSKPEKPGKESSEKEKEVYKNALAEWQKSHDLVVSTGGLHIIGSDRHDSRRIDNQLRGRAGRQGDPGSSRFYVSLEDDLMRIFGGERVAKIMDALKIPEDQPIESGMVSKSIEQAQTKVEGFHFDQRKRVVEYDDVMNKQREIIYKRRYKVLKEADQDEEESPLKDKIIKYIDAEIEHNVLSRSADGFSDEEADAIVKEYLSIIPFDKTSQAKIRANILKANESEQIIEELKNIAIKTYQDRESDMGEDNMRSIERFVLLGAIDRMWMNHLDEMDDLREGIWMRGSKETVLSEYKKEAFDMFGTLMDKINAEVAHNIFRIQIANTAQPSVPQNVVTGKDEGFAQPARAQTTPSSKSTSTQGTGAFAAALGKTTNRSARSDGRNPIMIDPTETSVKVGRNDPCPCGSGKKFKKCGLINAPEHKSS
jgi:preprotein translocase subunit SecA